jgi:hypothetical protein
VPRVEFACCRVGCDGDMTTARPGRATLRPLLEPGVRTCHQLVHLHGMGNRHHMRRSGRVHVPGSRHVVRLASWSEMEISHANKLLVVQGGDLSCDANTGRTRRRLVVQGGDWSDMVVTSWRGFL